MKTISELIETNKFLHWLYQKSFLSALFHWLKKAGLFIYFKTRMVFQAANTLPRKWGFYQSKYESLKAMAGRYSGKRCFICCTGPSLTIEDLEKLKNEYVFGMNSICLIHDKTDWKPDFFAIQDSLVFEKLREAVLNTDNGIVFAPIQYKKKYHTPIDWVYFHISGAYHLWEMRYGPRYFAKFSDDAYSTVYDGYSITYSLMQIAIYLGFEQIYLLGADCNYLGKQQHFIESGHYDPGYKEAAKRMMAAYEKARDYCENHSVKIFNATRGGCLELFPRIRLEDVLNNKEKNKNCD